MSRRLNTIILIGLVIAAGATAGRLPAEPPAMPKLSSIVPAEDLAGQFQSYVKELDASLADEATYKSSADKIKRVANTVAALAFCLRSAPTKVLSRADDIGAAARALAKARIMPRPNNNWRLCTKAWSLARRDLRPRCLRPRSPR